MFSLTLKKSLSALAAAAVFVAVTTVAKADEQTDKLKKIVEDKVVPAMHDPVIIAAIKAGNEAHKDWTNDQIIAKDKEWRAQVDAAEKPLISSVMSNEASQHLVKVQGASNGLIEEVFVMDDKGLNVAQSEVTSDYWQGDEAKWQETYGKKSADFNVGAVEFDESTQAFVSQVSFTVNDPATHEPIGAVTVSINMDQVH